jgi:polar amino acid transport system substrate-binding protein
MKTFASFEKYDTYTIAVNDLKAGAIDAIAIDVTTGDYQMTKVEGLAYLDEDVCQEVYAIGFRTDDTELRDQVNAALKTLAENGKMDEIGQKYPEIYENLSMINN